MEENKKEHNLDLTQKTEVPEPPVPESPKETSPAARQEIMYDKAYRNCRPVPDLYCIHSETKLAECLTEMKPD